jgi:cytochrome c551/c552
MSSSRSVLVAARVLALGLAACAAQAQTAPSGIGRVATPKELAAWDIDVRPDFKGLPAGSGSVAKGQEVWEGKCASCHGVFGESNQTFSPLVGGTTAADIVSGRVARLTDPVYPGRTTLMKLSNLSTLWDYIHRAMPWTQPKSLSPDEVYAVTAYMLNLGDIVPENFTLSDRNMAEVQKRLPNRDGMTTEHALWPGKPMGRAAPPDVKAVACMTNCGPEPKVVSFLPEFARDAHGNLADQNRLVGPQRGADTTRPAGMPPGAAAARAVPALAKPPGKSPAEATAAAALALTKKHACVACHGLDSRIVGPSFREVAAKYAGRDDAVAYLSARIRSGSTGQWGAVPMPPQALADAEARSIAQWLADGPVR